MTERKCPRCGVTIAEADKAHAELCCLCCGGDYRIEVQGLDFSVELPGGKQRLAVDLVLDRWPPLCLGLRIKDPDQDDMTASYGLIARGEVTDLTVHDENSVLRDATVNFLHTHDLDKKRIRDLEDEVAKMKNAIIGYRERPGCNPGSRRLAMRRLLWAAGSDLPN